MNSSILGTLNECEWVKVVQLCPTLCNSMDYIVHAILQGNLPNPETEPRSLPLQGDSLPPEPPGANLQWYISNYRDPPDGQNWNYGYIWSRLKYQRRLDKYDQLYRFLSISTHQYIFLRQSRIIIEWNKKSSQV